MKILHVISSIDPASGGPPEGLRQLRQSLTLQGVQSDICCCDPPDAGYLAAGRPGLVALGPSQLRYAFNRRLFGWLARYSAGYDAVIVNGIWQFHGLAVWLALRGGNVPYFVFTHGMLDPWFRQRYPLKHAKKLLYWTLCERHILRDARAVLFTAEEERVRARQSFPFYQCRELVTSYGTALPPQDGERLRAGFLAAHPGLRGRRLLLFLGRIHEKKGGDLLVQAFAAVAGSDPALHLVMAGPCDAEMRARLERIAGLCGVGARITWTGMLEGDAKWGAFYAADAFCLPSHQENFGVAVAEALGCGLPVLISDKVNIWRETERSGAGLVAPDSLAGTIDVLQRWLGLDAARRRAMGANARRAFDESFHSARAAARLRELIEAETVAAREERLMQYSR